jgi:hypothetical protein
MEQSSPSEADSSAAGHELICLLENSKVHYHVGKPGLLQSCRSNDDGDDITMLIMCRHWIVS